MTEPIPRYPYVHVRVPSAQTEMVGDLLWTLGCTGVEERDETTLLKGEDGQVLLVASFENDDAAHRAVAAMSFPARVEWVVGDEWRDAWRAYFHPRKLGERLWIRPSWRELETGPDEVVLTIDPGGAFGSGIHETTRLVLAEVDALVRPGDRVFDVGCGSGILAVAALLLGAETAIGVDVEDAAVAVSEENAELNGVGGRLEVSTRPMHSIEGTFDLVLANIQAPILIDMAEALCARTQRVLVLSGVLEDRLDEVVAAFAEVDASFEVRVTAEGEWRAIVLTRA